MPRTRTANTSPSKSKPSSVKSAKSAPNSRTRSKPKARVVENDDDDFDEEVEEEEEEVKEYDSDALDDDNSELDRKKKTKKRKRTVSPVKKAASRKKKRAAESEEEDEDEFELKEGQEVVGSVVQAPKIGRVPPGQISKNTLDFLRKLRDPKCNDREWFKLHEPVYRQAEQEWKDFVESFTDILTTDIDTQVPPLPPKDVIHRIYRDIRFSNDKTPYKKNMSASFSRGGRKGIFAAYHISVSSEGDTLLAAGSWCPGKNELATIRSNIIHDPSRLRGVLSAPEFVSYFGEPKPRADGGRQSIFGNDDELKTAPKGIDKTHKDIDLLKCRSFAVFYKYKDEEVLAPDFKEKLAELGKVVQPLVHCLNDMMTLRPADDDDDEEEEEA